MKNQTLGIFSINGSAELSKRSLSCGASVRGAGKRSACVSFPGIVLLLWFCRATVMWLQTPKPPPPTSTASACDLVSHHTKVIRVWERMDACTGLWKTDRFISARTSAVHNGPKIDDKLQFNDYARRCVKYWSAVYTCVKVIKDSTRRANNIHLWKTFLTSDDSAVQVFLNSSCCAAHLPSPSWR